MSSRIRRRINDIWHAYVAGTWLATLSGGEALAALMNFAAECADWLARGKAAYQEKLWMANITGCGTIPKTQGTGL